MDDQNQKLESQQPQIIPQPTSPIPHSVQPQAQPNVIQPFSNSTQNTGSTTVSSDNQQTNIVNSQQTFVANPNDVNSSSNAMDSNNVGKTVGKFFFGGTNNVDRIDRFTNSAVLSFVFYIVTLLVLVGMSYLHYKHSDSWLRIPFIAVTILGLTNIVYYGWVKRELLFGRGIWLNVVRHGTAVAISFFYMAGIAIVAGVGWNYASVSKTPTSTQSSHTIQTNQ